MLPDLPFNQTTASETRSTVRSTECCQAPGITMAPSTSCASKLCLPYPGEAGAFGCAVLICSLRWVCGGHVDSQSGFGVIWGSQVGASFGATRKTVKEALAISSAAFLAVQWLGLCTPAAVGMLSIAGQRTKIPQAAQRPDPKGMLMSRRKGIFSADSP